MPLKRSQLKVDKYNRTTQCPWILVSKSNMQDDECCGIPLKRHWDKHEEWWVYDSFCPHHAEKARLQEENEEE